MRLQHRPIGKGKSRRHLSLSLEGVDGLPGVVPKELLQGAITRILSEFLQEPLLDSENSRRPLVSVAVFFPLLITFPLGIAFNQKEIASQLFVFHVSYLR